MSRFLSFEEEKEDSKILQNFFFIYYLTQILVSNRILIGNTWLNENNIEFVRSMQKCIVRHIMKSKAIHQLDFNILSGLND